MEAKIYFAPLEFLRFSVDFDVPNVIDHLIIKEAIFDFNASDAVFVFPNWWWPVKVGQKKWSLLLLERAATVFFGMRVTVKWVYGVRMCPRPPLLPWISSLTPWALSCSWEFQKRLTCHLCVVVSKIRVWKRDFKQSAIIEGAYLNVFFMSTLGRFFS